MKNLIVPFGLLLILLATVAPFFLRDYEWALTSYRYVFAAGAVILLIARLMQRRTASDLRLRRLYRLEVWVAVIFCVAAFFLFYPGASRLDSLHPGRRGPAGIYINRNPGPGIKS